MSRFEPRNREEAFSFQFEEDARVLKCLAMQGEKDFEKGIATLEAHIAAYRSKRLKKACEKVKKRNIELDKFIKNRFRPLISESVPEVLMN